MVGFIETFVVCAAAMLWMASIQPGFPGNFVKSTKILASFINTLIFHESYDAEVASLLPSGMDNLVVSTKMVVLSRSL